MENTRYIESVGRRKTAVARVRLYESPKSSFVINDAKDTLNEYGYYGYYGYDNRAKNRSKHTVQTEVNKTIKKFFGRN